MNIKRYYTCHLSQSESVFTGSCAVQPIEVLGSSSAAEDSTASSAMSSSSHIHVPVEPDNSGRLKSFASV